MFDVGVGELLVLMVLALLVFGPDKLPQVVAQATHWIRQLREQAASARADLADAVDLDSTGLKDLADLHPKRIAASVLAPVEDVKREVSAATAPVKDAVDEVGRATSSASNGSRPAAPSPGSTPSPPPPASPGSALFDPDAT